MFLILLVCAGVGAYFFYVEVILDCYNPGFEIFNVNWNRDFVNDQAWWEEFGWVDSEEKSYKKYLNAKFCRDGFSCFEDEKIRTKDCEKINRESTPENR